MNYNGMNGSFGSDRNHHNRPENNRSNRNSFSFHPLNIDLKNNERVVDIVGVSVIALFVLLSLIFWNSFSDWLFYAVLFPIISVGWKVIVILLIIVAVLAFIRFRLRCFFGPWRY